MVARLMRVRAAVGRQRRGRARSRRPGCPGTDDRAGCSCDHLDLRRRRRGMVGAERRVDGDQPHPRRGARGMVRAERPAPPRVEHRRAGAADVQEDVGLRRSAAALRGRPQARSPRQARARRCPAGSRGRAAPGRPSATYSACSNDADRHAPRRRRAQGRGRRAQRRSSGRRQGRVAWSWPSLEHEAGLADRAGAGRCGSAPGRPARVALEAAEQDALEVVRRHEAVERGRRCACRWSG